jgi:hypothetical protein
MNLMSRKYLLNQATCSPDTFDDIHSGDINHPIKEYFVGL